jgi:hypothetical protein
MGWRWVSFMMLAVSLVNTGLNGGRGTEISMKSEKEMFFTSSDIF